MWIMYFNLLLLVCPFFVNGFSFIELGKRLLSYIIRVQPSRKHSCRFSLNEDIPMTPLILTTHPRPRMVYPDKENFINLNATDRLRLSCGDKQFNVRVNGEFVRDVMVTCVRDTIVSVGNEKMSLSDLECQDFPTSTIQVLPSQKCNHGNTVVNVGYRVGKSFLKVFSVCFNRITQDALYTWYDSSKLRNTGHQFNVPRTEFKDKELYQFDVDAAYYFHNQRTWIGNILGSYDWGDRFIVDDHQHYLCRGHLTPKADFVYGVEQAATFHFINAAPQWQIFNIGNWVRLETAVRLFLLDRQHRYRVVTGTHGVATLPDVNNNEQELFLYEDKNKNPLLKVPKLFWKIVYDINKDDGVAIIGVNNPYLERIPPDYIICRDICEQIPWVPSFSRDPAKGYIYCCNMDEFLRATGFDKSFLN